MWGAILKNTPSVPGNLCALVLGNFCVLVAGSLYVVVAGNLCIVVAGSLYAVVAGNLDSSFTFLKQCVIKNIRTASGLHRKFPNSN